MKLWEALKSGKRFRFKGEEWIDPNGTHDGRHLLALSKFITQSDDWEVEPGPKPPLDSCWMEIPLQSISRMLAMSPQHKDPEIVFFTPTGERRVKRIIAEFEPEEGGGK